MLCASQQSRRSGQLEAFVRKCDRLSVLSVIVTCLFSQCALVDSIAVPAVDAHFYFSAGHLGTAWGDFAHWDSNIRATAHGFLA